MEEIGEAQVHRPKVWGTALTKGHLTECSGSHLSGLYKKGKLSGRIPGPTSKPLPTVCLDFTRTWNKRMNIVQKTSGYSFLCFCLRENECSSLVLLGHFSVFSSVYSYSYPPTSSTWSIRTISKRHLQSSFNLSSCH